MMRGRGDSNPQPPDRQSSEGELQEAKPQEVAPTASPVCTRVCTSEAENANAGAPEGDQGQQGEGTAAADPLVAIAAAIAGLSPADRQRLAGILGEAKQ